MKPAARLHIIRQREYRKACPPGRERPNPNQPPIWSGLGGPGSPVQSGGTEYYDETGTENTEQTIEYEYVLYSFFFHFTGNSYTYGTGIGVPTDEERRYGYGEEGWVSCILEVINRGNFVFKATGRTMTTTIPTVPTVASPAPPRASKRTRRKKSLEDSSPTSSIGIMTRPRNLIPARSESGPSGLSARELVVQHHATEFGSTSTLSKTFFFGALSALVMHFSFSSFS